MSFAECCICLAGLADPAFEDEDNGNQVVSLLSCGHVMHAYCVLHLDNELCPQCQVPFRQRDFQRIYLSFAETPPCEVCVQKDASLREKDTVISSQNHVISAHQTELERAIAQHDFKLETVEANHRRSIQSKDFEIMELTSRLQRMDIGGATGPLGFGARYHLMINYEDSVCLNCESRDHHSVDCKNPPVLRFTDQTTYEKWAPIADCRGTAVVQFDKETAGEVIKYFCSKFGIANPTRAQIQVMFGFTFFDDCCWICGSPFHHRPACKNEDAEVKNFAKLLHQTNHPLTEHQAAQQNRFRNQAVAASRR